jgi:hypothetical protein
MNAQLDLEIKVKVTLRPTVTHSIRLGVEPHLGLMRRFWLLSDSIALSMWGAVSDERTVLPFVGLIWNRVPRRIAGGSIRSWYSHPCQTG